MLLSLNSVGPDTEQEEQCDHPKLASWQDIFTRAHCYQCMRCGKEISIPAYQSALVENSKHNIAGIVGLAFGEKWREKALQEDKI